MPDEFGIVQLSPSSDIELVAVHAMLELHR